MTAHITEPGDQEFERLLHDGITAAKSDQRSLAQSLLRQAIILNNQDARPYVWLSATTDDPIEQREYLEYAVAVDPTNVAARRSLAILTGIIDPQYVIPEGIRPDYIPADQLPEIETASGEAQGQTFLCPQCGGPMSSAVQSGLLTCEYCGYVHIEASDTPAGAAGQVLDFVMPTALGHHWAGKQHRIACERCGAQSLLQAGQKTLQCPYCGSNQMIASTSGDDTCGMAWLGSQSTPSTLTVSFRYREGYPSYRSNAASHASVIAHSRIGTRRPFLGSTVATPQATEQQVVVHQPALPDGRGSGAATGHLSKIDVGPVSSIYFHKLRLRGYSPPRPPFVFWIATPFALI
jgi:ribosomal protein L37AE/L43A